MVCDLKGRRVTVVGLARSGVGAANMLAQIGATVTVTDKKSPQELSASLESLHPDVRPVLGEHPAGLFEEADLIVVSPGVPLSITPLRKAAERGKKIIGELELAYRFVKENTEAGGQKTDFLAITGTNGKSTTTTLVYEMLRNHGFETIVGGNIGTALTEELYKWGRERKSVAPDYIVVEVSSFQLETIETFRPTAAAILNITPDHLDRYRSMDEYIDAKCRVFMNQQREDVLVLNADDELTGAVLKRIEQQRARNGMAPGLFYFSRKDVVRGVFFKDGVIRFSVPERGIDVRMSADDVAIRGVHNIENAMAASLMALLCGCSPHAIMDTLKTFPGLEHRLEFVRELDGTTYINDSKGTNVGAVIKSLESFRGPIVLIAGGRDKDSDFTLLRPLVEERVKALILIGEAREKLRKALGQSTTTFMEDDLRAAVRKARAIAAPGDVVLLSPACASFDMFRDFEDRGRQFKSMVREL
ncbi:MAG: UDP-N-acetylmuramoyl-L-alanine--D-glutamate ligase [Nitrospirota bacterium]